MGYNAARQSQTFPKHIIGYFFSHFLMTRDFLMTQFAVTPLKRMTPNIFIYLFRQHTNK